MFEGADSISIKESLMLELHSNSEKIMSNQATKSISRNLLHTVCRVDIYSQYGIEEWRRKMEKSTESDDFLTSLNAMEAKHSAAKVVTNTDSGVEENVISTSTSKRKYSEEEEVVLDEALNECEVAEPDGNNTESMTKKAKRKHKKHKKE